MSAAHDRTAAMAIDASAAPAPPTDWQLALASKWQALGRELLGLHPGPRRRLAELGRELQCLAVAVALFETRGNLTLAAQHLGTHRRMVRERLADWRRANPQLVPSRPKPAPSKRRRRRRRKTQTSEPAPKVERDAP